MTTVISVQEYMQPDGSAQLVFQIEEPTNVADSQKVYQLNCDPDLAPFSDLKTISAHDKNPINGDLVKVAGEEVLQALSQHPGVRQAIDRAVSTQGSGPWPIYIETSAIDAEAVPWELLFHPQGQFLSLDPRWPIARQTGGKSDTLLHQFEPPLRIAAVLGAADVDATPEWEALRSAIMNANLDCSIAVLVADPALQTHIENQGDGFVSVEPIPETGDALIKRLMSVEPQFLHLFCHGSSDYSGYLEIATRNHTEFNDRPVYLASGELSRLRDLVWLITLNACEGATPANELHSFAYSLVNDGIPAAIGMREPIHSTDANLFCRAFYTTALAELATQLKQNQQVQLAWSPLLRAARSALCTQYGPANVVAPQHKQWTLPVLYQQPGKSIVVPVLEDAGLSTDEQARGLAALETLREVRTNIHPDTPAEVLERIDAQIQALIDQLSGAMPA